ncbi:NAD(P)H-binding protein [Streptomyces sp. NPDC001002]
MHIALFGATGLVGQGVLTACLADPEVTKVTAVTRRATGRAHPKLVEVPHSDFTDYSDLRDTFATVDALFYCLGRTSVGVSEAEYRVVTRDYALAAGRALAQVRPEAAYIYVSARNADSDSTTMWIRAKGRAEDELRRLDLRVSAVRPGWIQPRNGARPSVRAQRIIYGAAGPLFPLLKRRFPGAVTSTDAIAAAMLALARAKGALPEFVDTAGINALADASVPA